MPRIQVILSESEAARLKGQAARDGSSLSAWMREAALSRLEQSGNARTLHNREDLETLFQSCDQRHGELGHEPDWEDHLNILEGSRTKDLSLP